MQQIPLHVHQGSPDLGIKGGVLIKNYIFLLSLQFQITKSRISFCGERKPVLDLGF